MCGVFGYVTDRDEALGPILVEAAQRLTYRGYDSVGAATFRDGTIDLRKDVGKVDAVAARHDFAEMRGSRGIAQLRWATFGEPSQVNAQPHLDSDGAMVGAHNGNVVNNAELRVRVPGRGDDGPLGERRRDAASTPWSATSGAATSSSTRSVSPTVTCRATTRS